MNGWAQSIIDRNQEKHDRECAFCGTAILPSDKTVRATLGSTMFTFLFHAHCIDKAELVSKERGFDPSTFGRIDSLATNP